MSSDRSTTTAHMWNPNVETMDRDEIRARQGERLREQVKHVYENSDFFRELYDEAGVHPKDIEGFEDIRKLPSFDKDDLRAYRDRTGDFWCGTLCVPESEVNLTQHSTGTSGAPNFFGFTEDDLDKIGDLFARLWYTWGLRKGDTVPIPGRDIWNGHVNGMELGVQRVGANPIRSVAGLQNVMEVYFDDDVVGMKEADLDAVFVYQAEEEYEYLQEHDLDPSEIFPNLRFVFSAVDASDPKIDLWESTWGDIPFRNAYGSGDQVLTCPQCAEEDHFFHVPEDHFIIEVLDPETGEPVEPGEYGEVYLTNLRDEANPYIRYRLEDLVIPKYEPCDCGRTHMRIRPLGRLAWSVFVEGYDRPITSIQVENVIWKYDELYGKNYQMVEHQPGEQEELHVRIATEEDVPSDVIDKASSDLSDEFGVSARITVVTPDEIGLESAIKMERVAEDY